MDMDIDQLVLNAVNRVTNDLSILIVSKDSNGRYLREALNDHQEKRKLGYKFAVHITDSIEAILKVIPRSKISFVVFLIDPQNEQCFQEVQLDVGRLSEMLLFGRTCLVRHDGNNLNQKQQKDTSFDIWALCEKFGLNLIVDNLTTPGIMISLAARILQLLEATCGVNTGMPYFTGQLDGLGYEEPASLSEI